jgi:hypothetical protein
MWQKDIDDLLGLEHTVHPMPSMLAWILKCQAQPAGAEPLWRMLFHLTRHLNS